MTWAVFEIETRPPNKTEWVTFVHVVPQFGPKHDMVGDTCWCEPETEQLENSRPMVVHRAMS